MNPHVNVVYCDDVRHEIGNKKSHIGIYGADLFVPEIPVVIPKLCLIVQVVYFPDNPINQLHVHIFKDDEQIAELKLNDEVFSRANMPMSPQPDEPLPFPGSIKRNTLSAELVLSPFVIDTPGTLRVVADTDKGELRGPSLRLRVRPSEVPTKPASATATELTTKATN